MVRATLGGSLRAHDRPAHKIPLDNSRSGYRLSTSVGGAATGEGGDRIVCDDPHNVQEAESDSVRKGTLDWWDIVMTTRVNDPKKRQQGGRHAAPPSAGSQWPSVGAGRLGAPVPPRRVREFTPGDFNWFLPIPGGEPNELLWPERFGPPEIESLKRSLGSYAAAGQLQQRRSPSGGGIIKRHWFSFWQLHGANFPPVEVRTPDGTTGSIEPVTFYQHDEVIQSWDCSFKDPDTSDYVVGQVWTRADANFLLLARARARMDRPATVKAVRDLSRRFPTTIAKLIEESEWLSCGPDAD